MDQAAAAADKDPQKAMTLLKSAIAIAPDTPRPRLLLAHVMMRIEEYPVAEKQYRWLLKELPGDETLHYKLARCLWLQDRNREAEAELVQAIKINPLYHAAHMLLSRMYEKAGKHALAVFSLEKAIENDGVEDYADVDALLRLLVLYLHLGEAEEVKRTRQRILDATPTDQHRIATRNARRLYNRSRDLYEEGDFPVAISVLGIALELRGVEETLADDIRSLARTVLLANEAKSMLGDELLPESLRQLAQVLYLDKGTEAQRKVRYLEMRELINGDNFTDARRMTQSVAYIRRQYKSIAKDSHLLLDDINALALRRVEALGGSVTKTMPIGDNTSDAMPTSDGAADKTADKRDDGGVPGEAPPRPPRSGILGWLRGKERN